MRFGVWLGLWAVSFWSVAASGVPVNTQAEWSRILRELEIGVSEIKAQLASAGIQFDTSGFDQQWNKIGPQARIIDRPIVVPFIGLHNCGKSTATNLFIGAAGDKRVTTVSSTGGSTTIPVALLPNSFAERDISLLFNGFQVSKSVRADDATEDAKGRKRLLWRKHALVPERLAIVDTPDLDSFHRANSEQTVAVVGVADVVAVMLTDQYANHDLMEMLKEVAVADKPVIFIFNKANLKYDAPIWKSRIAELQKESGVQAIGAFAIVDDREKAESGALLDFYDIGRDGTSTPKAVKPWEALQALQPERIRIQAELGALEVALGAEHGLDAFIVKVEETKRALAKLNSLLGPPTADKKDAEADAEKHVWPTLPGTAVGPAILETWGKHHRGTVTQLMRTVPYWIRRGLGTIVRLKYEAAMEEAERQYRAQEFEFLRSTVLDIVLKQLQALESSGNASGNLKRILSTATEAGAWSKMQAELQQEHSRLKLVDSALHDIIYRELDTLKLKHPIIYSTAQNLDGVIAALEILTPVGIGFGGGYLVSLPFSSSWVTSLAQGYVQVGTSAVVGAAAAPSASVSSDKLRGAVLGTFFSNIANEYRTGRVIWLMNWLRQHHLKEFYDELVAGAAATSSAHVDKLRSAVSCARRLATQLRGGN